MILLSNTQFITPYNTINIIAIIIEIVIIKYDDKTNIITDFEIIGGCNGNLKGIKSLIIGMNLKDVYSKLRGIKCGFKNTSCPDQIATAIEPFIN